ncbi:MAG5620 family putative phospho-sugar mutase [Mycoplasmopsis adleri]|uniref:MAG5620 family putative phospho-sugar mutase n=1 Tax=Mycoplasmopsis adleri TaxID=51362 RepID=UPI003873AD4E
MKNKEIRQDDIILYCNNSLILKADKKMTISDFSIQLLCELFTKYIFNNKNQKLLVSYEGNSKYYPIINGFSFYLTKNNHLVYNYDSILGVDSSLDELVCRDLKLDYCVKVISNYQDNNISVKIYDANENKKKFISGEVLKKIAEEFKTLISDKSNAIPYETTYKTELANLELFIQEQASKRELLRAFVNVRPRYKSKNLIITNEFYSNELINNLLTNYESNFSLKKADLKTKLYLFSFKTFQHRNYFNNNYQSLIKIDEYGNLDVSCYINHKLVNMNLNEIILVYLDFLIEELKRGKSVNIKDLFVLIAPNTSYQIIELLKQYNVKYIYCNEKSYQNLINNKNCLFAYTYNKINANPRYSYLFNNYYFFIYLIWMLNTYVNRNNLLSFKYNKLKENFGNIIYKNSRKKFDHNLIPTLISALINNYKKSNIYDAINVFKFWVDDTYALLKLVNTSSKHATILSYDYVNEQLIIENQLCTEYNQSDVPYFMNFHKMKSFINKTIKKVTKENKVQFDDDKTSELNEKELNENIKNLSN